MLAILICLCNLYLVAGLAQLVEQRIRNAWVGSSSLLTGTIPQPPKFDRRLKFFLIEIKGFFFPSIKKFAKTIFKICLFSSICELLKIAKEFWLKFNTLFVLYIFK